MVRSDSTTLPIDLQRVFDCVVDVLLVDTPCPRINYGTVPNLAALKTNEADGADCIVAYLDQRVRQRTKGARRVEFAKRAWLKDLRGNGLLVAVVPRGQSASSLVAGYFRIGGNTNGVYFYERAC